MYEDTYTKFNPENFQYSQCDQFRMTSEQPYCEWDYGDTFTLEFKLGKKALLKDYDIYIYIYNFRQDLVYETKPEELIIDKKGNVLFYIDQELSIKLIKGLYRCQVIAGNEEEQMTLIRPADCTLYVR